MSWVRQVFLAVSPRSRRRPLLERGSGASVPIVLAAVAMGAWAEPAWASGLSVARFGGEHGHPTTNNATALYFNPAGLTESTGTHVFVDGTLAWRKLSYWHPTAPTDFPEPAGAEGANTGEAELFNVLVSPMVGVHTRIEKLVLGAAFYTPFGGQSGYEKNERFEGSEYPGPVDGVNRWYAIDGAIRSSYFTLGAAYAFEGTGLSVGLSANLISSVVHTARARNPSSDNAVTREGRSLLDVSGWDWSVGLGIMYEAIPDRLFLGASYQSRPNLDGDMVLEGTLTNRFAGQTVSASEVDLHQSLPDVIRAGARYRPEPDIELRVFGDYTRWSAFERQCVVARGERCEVDGETGGGAAILNQERDWHDTFGIRLGSSLFPSERVEVVSGLGFSSNAVPAATQEPALPDWDSFSVALGVRLAVLERLHVAATYTQLFYVPRNTTGESELSQLDAPSRGPDAGGAYSHAVGALNANVDVAF